MKIQKKYKLCIYLAVFFLFFAHNQAETSDFSEAIVLHCIMGEARGDGYYGLLAVSEVIRKRGSLEGINGCDTKFKEPKKVWDLAKKAWIDSKYTNTALGATHFESIDFPTPYWAKDKKMLIKIGKHLFYE